MPGMSVSFGAVEVFEAIPPHPMATGTPGQVLGALGPILNTVVLGSTRCGDAAIAALRADGHSVRGEDVAWLSRSLTPTSTSLATIRSPCADRTPRRLCAGYAPSFGYVMSMSRTETLCRR
ncbi:hypothetical protein BL253_26135 [Pseudofrankia asymbiotica]|uniref:Uncharacterized protein n=1 Tax=Pseudofrankia asymbiotica TaxID=1834516 RepID=A0A1V2I5H0_9ACTN|nr:hypothetical protein BL253_26135 [Pseudofrankia asymbiotica]